jgi:hypothetical protein
LHLKAPRFDLHRQTVFAFQSLLSIFPQFMEAIGASVRVFELLDRVPRVNYDGPPPPCTPPRRLRCGHAAAECMQTPAARMRAPMPPPRTGVDGWEGGGGAGRRAELVRMVVGGWVKGG